MRACPAGGSEGAKTVEECWHSALKRISKLGGLVPGGAIPLQGVCPERVPRVSLLQHLIVQVSGKLAQQIRLEDAERLKV